jgi:hypothetical protein
MIRTNLFSKIEPSGKEFISVRKLATHHGKNYTDVEFCHNCKFIRLYQKAFGQQPAEAPISVTRYFGNLAPQKQSALRSGRYHLPASRDSFHGETELIAVERHAFYPLRRKD